MNPNQTKVEIQFNNPPGRTELRLKRQLGNKWVCAQQSGTYSRTLTSAVHVSGTASSASRMEQTARLEAQQHNSLFIVTSKTHMHNLWTLEKCLIWCSNYSGGDTASINNLVSSEFDGSWCVNPNIIKEHHFIWCSSNIWRGQKLFSTSAPFDLQVPRTNLFI